MAKLEINDHVTQKGTTHPVGIVEDIIGDFVRVRWGTADKRTWKDDFKYDELEKVPYPILSPEEVSRRQAEEMGGKLIEDSE